MSNDTALALDYFHADWSHRYGDQPPVAYVLRAGGQEPWVRFHALPHSKRYAKTPAEQQEILRRANILASEILVSDAGCWLVQCHIESPPTPLWKKRAEHAEAYLRYQDPNEDYHWLATVKLMGWQESAFDDLLTAIADDESGPTLWMSRGNGAIFAPYDGGFDVFPASHDEKNRLQAAYADWLSSHPSGL
jgi:hypothetical protein